MVNNSKMLYIKKIYNVVYFERIKGKLPSVNKNFEIFLSFIPTKPQKNVDVIPPPKIINKTIHFFVNCRKGFNGLI